MKTWVYVNWCSHIIISGAEYEEIIDDAIEHGDFDTDFEDWLSNNYSCRELFEMDEELQTDVRRQYINDLHEDLMDNGYDGYEPYSVDD